MAERSTVATPSPSLSPLPPAPAPSSISLVVAPARSKSRWSPSMRTAEFLFVPFGVHAPRVRALKVPRGDGDDDGDDHVPLRRSADDAAVINVELPADDLVRATTRVDTHERELLSFGESTLRQLITHERRPVYPRVLLLTPWRSSSPSSSSSSSSSSSTAAVTSAAAAPTSTAAVTSAAAAPTPYALRFVRRRRAHDRGTLRTLDADADADADANVADTALAQLSHAHTFTPTLAALAAREKQYAVRVHVAAHGSRDGLRIGGLGGGVDADAFADLLLTTLVAADVDGTLLGGGGARTIHVQLHSCRAAYYDANDARASSAARAPLAADVRALRARGADAAWLGRAEASVRIVADTFIGRCWRALHTRARARGIDDAAVRFSVAGYRGFLRPLASGKGAVVANRSRDATEQCVASSALFTIDAAGDVHGPDNDRWWYN